MQSVTNVKDIHREHATTPVDSITVLLLNAYIEPDWEQLSKSTKRSLCAKVKVPFNNMNCSTFYEKLHQTWASNKKNTENVCEECSKPYQQNGNNKFTTLLCGHRFCSQCIFNHIGKEEFIPSCPSHYEDFQTQFLPTCPVDGCGRCVFDDGSSSPPTIATRV